MSRNNMGFEMDLSRRTVINIVNRMEEIGIIQRDKDDNLRTTKKWYQAVILKCAKSAHPPVQKVHTPRAKSAHNNNINNNSFNNNMEGEIENLADFPAANDENFDSGEEVRDSQLKDSSEKRKKVPPKKEKDVNDDPILQRVAMDSILDFSKHSGFSGTFVDNKNLEELIDYIKTTNSAKIHDARALCKANNLDFDEEVRMWALYSYNEFTYPLSTYDRGKAGNRLLSSIRRSISPKTNKPQTHKMRFV